LEWSNKCIFKCAFCDEEISSRTRFGTHLKSQHTISITEYTKEHGKSILHEERHSCQIESCDASVLWDRLSIANHLRSVHDSMSIEDYRIKFMDNYVKKEIVKKEIPNILNSSDSKDNDLEWSNKCIFKCAFCDEEISSRTRFGTHLKSQHTISITEYTKEHGKSILHEERHSCQIESCDASVLWDRLSIANHLRSVHENMCIEDYKMKYMDNYVEKVTSSILNTTNSEPSWANRCIYKCNICGMTFKNSRRSFEKHMPRFHDMVLGDYTKEYGKTMEHEEKHFCQVETCDSKIVWEIKNISSHLKLVHDSLSLQEYEEKYMSNYKEKESSFVAASKPSSSSNLQNFTWANRCLYKCSLCELEFSINSAFKNHLKTKHDLLAREYGKQFGRTMAHEEKHSCQVENCNSYIWWDKDAIYFHLRDVHDKMALEEYEGKYMKNYQEKIKEEKSNFPNSPLLQKINPMIDADVLEWTAGSLYKCELCQSEVAGLYQFNTHLVNQHNSEYRQYEKKYNPKEFVLFSGFHLCKICQKNIRHDYQPLKNHMEEHSITISDYINKHKPKAPKLARKRKNKEETRPRI